MVPAQDTSSTYQTKLIVVANSFLCQYLARFAKARSQKQWQCWQLLPAFKPSQTRSNWSRQSCNSFSRLQKLRIDASSTTCTRTTMTQLISYCMSIGRAGNSGKLIWTLHMLRPTRQQLMVLLERSRWMKWRKSYNKLISGDIWWKQLLLNSIYPSRSGCIRHGAGLPEKLCERSDHHFPTPWVVWSAFVE